MHRPEHFQLMFAVLDGEASAAEAAALDPLLAADPAARAQFDELRRLFEHLERVPELTPPQGLLESVVARFARRHGREATDGQPFGPSRVSRLQSEDPSRSPSPETTKLQRDMTMSQPTSGSPSKRKVWIGIAVAAVAVGLVGHYALDFPTGGENAAGTIVPAQRYRAEQIKPEDLRLGDQSVAQLMQTDPYDRLVKDPQF